MRTRQLSRAALRARYNRDVAHLLAARCPTWRLTADDRSAVEYHFTHHTSAADCAGQLSKWYRSREKFCPPHQLRPGDRIACAYGIVTVRAVEIRCGRAALSFYENQPPISCDVAHAVERIVNS